MKDLATIKLCIHAGKAIAQLLDAGATVDEIIGILDLPELEPELRQLAKEITFDAATLNVSCVQAHAHSVPEPYQVLLTP